MPWRQQPDILALISALLISVISGFISIAQRIARGHKASKLWVVSEFSAAILSGYLMADVYPIIKPSLPEWATLTICVALAAHIGGRMFQMLETVLAKKYGVDKIPDDIPTYPPDK